VCSCQAERPGVVAQVPGIALRSETQFLFVAGEFMRSSPTGAIEQHVRLARLTRASEAGVEVPMKCWTILASLPFLCASAHAGDELAFEEHGFSLTLADGWIVREIAPLYEQYISANAKALGETSARVLRENSQIVFKANRGDLSDETALFTCVIGRNLDDLEEITPAQEAALIEGVALNSYRAMVARGMNATPPVFEEKYGFLYSTYRMTQEGGRHTTDYKVFVAGSGMIVCAGAAVSEYADDIAFMHDSIRVRVDGR
jgi:hypothetical protein